MKKSSILCLCTYRSEDWEKRQMYSSGDSTAGIRVQVRMGAVGNLGHSEPGQAGGLEVRVPGRFLTSHLLLSERRHRGWTTCSTES